MERNKRPVRNTRVLGCNSSFLAWWLKGIKCPKVRDGEYGCQYACVLICSLSEYRCMMYTMEGKNRKRM